MQCARIVFYPRARCPHCSADALSWATVSGRGTIYSFTVVHRRASTETGQLVPYVVALVDLAEGGRLMTNIVGCPIEEVAIGLPVRVTFKPVSDAVSLPLFVPTTSRAEATAHAVPGSP